MVKVHSSNIDAVKYNDDKTLEVHFKSGKVYHYSNVSKSTYDQFVSAPSVGRHLHSHIHPYHTLAKKN